MQKGATPQDTGACPACEAEDRRVFGRQKKGRRKVEGTLRGAVSASERPRVYLVRPCNSIPLRLAPLASESRAFSSTSSSTSPSPSSSSNGKLGWRRGDNSDRVEVLQLSGGDGEHAATVSSPCPRVPAMGTEKEPGEGRDLALQSGRNRVSEAGEAALHGPAAHI